MANEVVINLDIRAKLSDLEGQVSKMQKEFDKLEGPTKLTKSMQDTFNDLTNRITKVKELTASGKINLVDEKKVRAEIDKIEKDFGGLIDKAETNGKKFGLAEGLRTAKKEADALRAGIEKYTSVVGKAEKEVERQEQSLKKTIAVENAKKQQAQELLNVRKKEKEDAEATLKTIKETTQAELQRLEAKKKSLEEGVQTRKDKMVAKNPTLTPRQVNAAAARTKESIELDNTNKQIAESQARLTAAIENTTKAQQAFEAQEKETANVVSSADKAINEQKSKFDILKESLNSIKGTELENLKNTLKELQSKGEINLGFDVSQIQTAEQLEEELRKIDQQDLEKVQAAIRNFIAGAKEGKKGANQLNTGIGQTAEKAKELNSQFEQFKSRITYFFGAANAVNLFKRAVRSAFNTVKDLDKVMAETAVVTSFDVGDMWAQLPEYTKRANELGVSIHDAYEAATLYYQQGLKTNEVMAVSNETLKMARIAGLDAADATDRMTNALRGFNMEITEANAQNINDVYSNLAAKTASNVDEISTAMTKVASLANNANMSFENTAAFLSQIIETTRESAETAGTALKTVVARFSEVKSLYSKGELLGDLEGEEIDVNKVSKALRTAGINLNEYLTGAKGLDEIFMELSAKWNTLDQVQQRYIATMAAGSRQQSRFIALMQDNARMTELVSEANNASGASQEQFNKTLESLETKLNQLKNAWNTFLMGIANNSIIKGAIDLLTGLLTTLNKISDGLPGVLGSFTKLSLLFASFKLGGAFFKKIFASIGGAMRGEAATSGTRSGQAWGTRFKASIAAQGGGIKGTFKTAFFEPVYNEAQIFEKKLESTLSLSGIAENQKKEIMQAYNTGDWEAAEKKASSLGITLNKTEIESTELDSRFNKMQPSLARFGTAAMGAGMAIGLLGRLFDDGSESGQRISKVFSTISSVLMGVGGALMMLQPIIKMTGLELKKAFPWLAAISGAILGIIGVIKLLNANSPEAKLAAMSDAAKEAAEAADHAKESYNNLSSALDSLGDKYKNLKELTYGTEEWRKAVNEVNLEVLDLISKYPQLAAFVQNKKGVLEIDVNSKGIQKVLKQYQVNALRAANAASLANINLSKAQLAKNKSDLVDKLPTQITFGPIKVIDSQTNKDIDIIAKGLAGDYESLQKFNTNTQEEFNEQLKRNINSLNGFDISSQKTLQDLQKYGQSLLKIRQEIEANYKSMAFTIVQESELEGDAATYATAYLNSGRIAQFVNKGDTLISRDKHDKDDLREEYAQQIGYNNYAQFKKENGDKDVSDEVLYTTLAASKGSELASDQLKTFSENIAKASDAVKHFYETEKGLGLSEKDIKKIYGKSIDELEPNTVNFETFLNENKQSLEAFAESIGEKIEIDRYLVLNNIYKAFKSGKMNQDQARNILRQEGLITGDLPTDAKNWEYFSSGNIAAITNVASAKDQYDAIVNLKEVISDIDALIPELSSRFKDMSGEGTVAYGALAEFAQNFRNMYLSLNTEDSDAFLDNMDAVIEKLSPDKARKFVELFNNINFDEAGLKEFKDSLAQSGIYISDTSTEYNELIEMALKYSKLIKTNVANSLAGIEKLTSIQAKILSGEQKRNFSKEAYESLVSGLEGYSGSDEILNQFAQSITGEYIYLGNSMDDLESAVREATKAIREQKITEATDKLNAANTLKSILEGTSEEQKGIGKAAGEAARAAEEINGIFSNENPHPGGGGRGISGYSGNLSNIRMVPTETNPSDIEDSNVPEGFKSIMKNMWGSLNISDNDVTTLTEKQQKLKEIANQNPEILETLFGLNQEKIDKLKPEEVEEYYNQMMDYESLITQSENDLNNLKNDTTYLQGYSIADLFKLLLNGEEDPEKVKEAIKLAINQFVKDEAIVNQLITMLNGDSDQIKQVQSIMDVLTEANKLGIDTTGLSQFAESLDLVKGEAYKVALANSKLNTGLKYVVESYKDWNTLIDRIVTKDGIKITTQEDAEAFNKLKTAVQTMLNTSEDLSDEFWTNEENMKALKALALGDTEALETLQKAAAKDYLVQTGVIIDDDGIDSEIEKVWNIIENIDLPKLEAGVELNQEEYTKFLTQLYNLMMAIDDTGELANKVFDNIGYTVEVKYKDIELPGRQVAGDVLAGGGIGNHYIPLLDDKIVPRKTQIPEIHFTSTGSGGGGVNQTNLNTMNTNSSNTSSNSSSSKPTYWTNPYDELYNLQEKINKAIREREALERRYQKLLKSSTASLEDIRKGYRDQIAALQEELRLQQQLAQSRLGQISRLGNQLYTDANGNRRSFNSYNVQRYVQFNAETGEITIDWAALEAIANDPNRSDEGKAIETYINKLQELVQSYQGVRDAVWKIEDEIEQLQQEAIDSYVGFEDRVMEALVSQYQKEIDSLEKINDTIQDATSKMLDSIQEQIEAQRQERQNAKTEEEIAKKEARLAYLRLDTSGANSLEIMQLEKELEEARQNYEDSLIDQALEQMRKDADLAAEQRAQQIEIMRAQLTYAQESGALWSEVYDLINGAFDENGEINMDSDLVKLLQAVEGFDAFSAFGQDEWIKKFVEALWQAWAGLEAGGAGSAGEHQGNGNSGGSGGSGEGSGEGSGGSGNTGGGNTNEEYPYGKASEVEGTVQKGSTNKRGVKAIQWALNHLGMTDSNGNALTIDGNFGNKTEQAVKRYQRERNLSADGKVGRKTKQAFAIDHYKTGGLADYTGLAWLDGTKTHPELVLNARDAENFILLKDILAKLVGPGIVTPGAPVGDAYYDIDINADIGSDYDVQRLADEIKRQIVQDTKYRNVNMINFIR